METNWSSDVAGTTADADERTLKERVEGMWASLSPTERKVGETLVHYPPEKLVFATAEDLARLAGTSDATIVRTARRLGYTGLPELKREAGAALTQTSAPKLRLQQRIAEVGADLGAAARRVILETQELVEQTHEVVDVEKLGQAVGMLAEAEEVVAYGVGGSELAARHLSLKLNRLGHRARFVGTTGFRLADDLLGLRGSDVVVLYVPGRLLPDADVLLDRAKATGAGRIAVSEQTLTDRLGDRIDVGLRAPLSAGGSVAESLTSLVLTDILLLGVAAIDEPRALYTSDLLSNLRDDLLDNGR